MPSTNYFQVLARRAEGSVTAHPFFFDDRDELSTAVAFADARNALAERRSAGTHLAIVAWKRPLMRGAWDGERVGLIGSGL